MRPEAHSLRLRHDAAGSNRIVVALTNLCSARVLFQQRLFEQLLRPAPLHLAARRLGQAADSHDRDVPRGQADAFR